MREAGVLPRKGAFDAEQAIWAQTRFDAADLSPLTPGATYLLEDVYPESRIVDYCEEPVLIMGAAYNADGRELADGQVLVTC